MVVPKVVRSRAAPVDVAIVVLRRDRVIRRRWRCRRLSAGPRGGQSQPAQVRVHALPFCWRRDVPDHRKPHQRDVIAAISARGRRRTPYPSGQPSPVPATVSPRKCRRKGSTNGGRSHGAVQPCWPKMHRAGSFHHTTAGDPATGRLRCCAPCPSTSCTKPGGGVRTSTATLASGQQLAAAALSCIAATARTAASVGVGGPGPALTGTATSTRHRPAWPRAR